MKNTVCYIILTIVLTLTDIQSARAQFNGVNYDYETIAAMVSGYGAEAGIEMMYQQNTSKIAQSYAYSELAAAGIFASKLLDRNALKSSQGFGSPDENYYYRKIYRLVANKIIPRTVRVTEKLVKDPSTSIYWGSYLLRVMADTKSLCQQFSTVVTNSTLNFNDIPFLAFNAALQQVFDLQTIGNIRHTLENLANIGGNFTTENIESEFENLQNLAVGLAQAGSGSISDLASGSLFDGTFKENVRQIRELIDSNTTAWDAFSSRANSTLTSITNANTDDITAILTTNQGNTEGWISSYSSGSNAQYYKQRVYIYHTDSGSEQISAYDPPADRESITHSDHYVRFPTDKEYYSMTYSDKQQALNNSYSHSGWNQDKIDQLNAAHDGFTYKISTWSHGYSCYNTDSENNRDYYAYSVAYSVYVIRSWNTTDIYYEDTFDSYNMDWNLFMQTMQARLDEANRNEGGKFFRIGYDNKIYYNASNERKIRGATQASFVTNCQGSGKLIDGSFQYKCSHCGRNPSDHTKECTMATTLQRNDFSYGEINKAISDTEQQMSILQGQIDVLNSRNRDILKQLSSTSIASDEYKALQNEYQSNKSRLNTLQQEYDTLADTLEGYKNAKQDAIDFENGQQDDEHRIPSIMHELQTNFPIEWIDEGHWEGFTFVRQARMNGLKSVVTFRATISIARPPKYFLFIKIHRAVVQISYDLTAEYSDSQVIETMKLDPDASGEEQNAKVNERLHELQEEYPDCSVNVEFEYSPGLQEDNDDDDRIHLLWASDRLDVAREICHRLEQMYVDLVVLDKFLHYKHSIIDWLRDLTVNNLHTERGRRLSIAERSRRRWMHNAQSTHYEREEEDDNYEAY